MARLSRRPLDAHQIKRLGQWAKLGQSASLSEPAAIATPMNIVPQGDGYRVAKNRRERRFEEKIRRRFVKACEKEQKSRKRSVNMYMMFRALLKGLDELENLQQKDASPIIGVLWERDIFKSKWAILARAFTLIRDAGAGGSVEDFLAIACPLIGIIPVDQYLASTNWLLEIRAIPNTQRATVILRQTSTPDINSFPANIARTNLTDLDIITACGDQGYLPVAIATGITQGWLQANHHMNQLASQGAVSVTNHLASTQNAYGHWQLPIERRMIERNDGVVENTIDWHEDEYDVPLPAPDPVALAAAAAAGVPQPAPVWPPTNGSNMMVGWWNTDVGAVDVDAMITPEELETYNPADLGNQQSFDDIAITATATDDSI